MFKHIWPPGFRNISFIFFNSLWFRLFLIGEHIRGDVYAEGHPAHALYLLNARSWSFASRSQFRNALKINFLNVYFVHASIFLIVKPRTYSCPLFDFTFYFIIFYFYFYVWGMDGHVWHPYRYVKQGLHFVEKYAPYIF